MAPTVDPLAALVSEEQQHHGQNIVNVFAAGSIRHALLWADVQAGKTGTYHHVIRRMLKRRIVKRVYILCGSSEITLKKQAMADLLKYNGDMAGQITVLFRTEFKKGVMDVKDALIVVDESHLDQTINQQMDKFLVGHGLYLDGTTPKMAEDNTFVLTVDATPYSEYAAWFHKKCKPKHIEMFTPSNKYYGIKRYLEDGHIRETFDFNTPSGLLQMETLMDRFPSKYLMFRIEGRGNVAKSDVLRALCRRKKFNFLEYTEAKDEIAITRAEQVEAAAAGKVIPCMEDAPEKTTLILVKGRLRAGKVVPKAHVGFVWENARSAKTDSIVQGLLGRMCGYLLADGETNCYKVGDVKPLIFLPKMILEKQVDTVIPLSELDRHIARDAGILPKRATNLKKGRTTSAADNDRTQVPIVFIPREMFGDDVEHFTVRPVADQKKPYDAAGLIKTKCLEVLRERFDELLAPVLAALTEEQIEEIGQHVDLADANDTNYRLLEGGKHHSGKPNSIFKQLRAAVASHTAPSEHITGAPDITFTVVLNPTGEPGARHGDVFVTMYTDARNPSFASAKPTDKVAEENGKSLFSVRVRASAVAASAVTINSHALRTPDDFIAAMSERIATDRSSRYWHSDSIGTVHEKFVFDKAAFAYMDQKDNALEKIVKPALEALHGVHIRIQYNNLGRPARNTFAVKAITWD